MIIKKFAFGDSEEAFIEERFKGKVNVIYTDSNNKGKTLVAQGIMYALGNAPAFPDTIDENDFYFYICVELKSKEIEILRKHNSYAVIYDKEIFSFNSNSELKYFINEYMFDVPEIEKGSEFHLVDLALLYELFFVGQDKKDTSHIISKGYYKNEDFFNMLYSIDGIEKTTLTSEDLKRLRKERTEKNKRLKTLRRDQEKMGAESNVYDFILESRTESEIEQKHAALKEIHKRITKLRKDRNREENRKLKYENLIEELNSLNFAINSSSIACGDCGSENIIFKNKDINFDISNSTVKKSILHSIEVQIKIKNDLVYELTQRIVSEKENLSEEMEDITPDYRDLLLYKDEVDRASELEPKIIELIQVIDDISQKLKAGVSITDEDKSRRKEVINNILELMGDYSSKIDSEDGGTKYKGIFTKKGKTVSGSESQVFYLCKLLAFRDYFNHEFPIVIDDFRDKEISTAKENNIIKLAEELPNQFIFTATLKEEEYRPDKYISTSTMNAIDYSSNMPKKILTKEYSAEFTKLVEKFSVIFD